MRAKLPSAQSHTATSASSGRLRWSCSRGVSAFGLYGNYVVIAELTCTEEYEGDERQQLARFLDGCHYASEYLKKEN